MPEHKIQIDRVDELIRWHLPTDPVRPRSRLPDSGNAGVPARLPRRVPRAASDWPPAEQSPIL